MRLLVNVFIFGQGLPGKKIPPSKKRGCKHFLMSPGQLFKVGYTIWSDNSAIHTTQNGSEKLMDINSVVSSFIF